MTVCCCVFQGTEDTAPGQGRHGVLNKDLLWIYALLSNLRSVCILFLKILLAVVCQTEKKKLTKTLGKVIKKKRNEKYGKIIWLFDA